MTLPTRKSLRTHIHPAFVFILIIATTYTRAQQDGTVHLRSGLSLMLPRQYAETIVAPNPIEAMLATDRWKEPHRGDQVTFADGSQGAWRSIGVDSAGWFTDSSLRGCYLFCTVRLSEDRVMLLEAMGNEMVYVNGTPRSGNPYGLQDVSDPWAPSFNYSRIPVPLRKGSNDFLFRCSRGIMKAKLTVPHAGVMLNTRDVTSPDLVLGDPIDAWCALPIVNGTDEERKGLRLKVAVNGNSSPESEIPSIQPFSIRKCAFRLTLPPPSEKGFIIARLILLRGDDVLDTASIRFSVVERAENRKETFISAIDGSVQYYSVLQPKKPVPGKLALFLSLHGAAVEAVNQSASYAPKPWGILVAPTNRRPYGFNWEEWGRLDALEVLDIAKKRFPIDESRVYLTGHSMGGHGTWHLGSLYPDQFGAIGPSAGWISFWTYRFRGKSVVDSSAVRQMIRRSTTPSETFRSARNLAQLGVYIIHGDQDDNVLPDQSRMMADTLAKFHRDFVYHEEKGAGHWWDNSEDGGSDCVDFPPLFDFFARHARLEKHRVWEIDFRTANPGVSSRNNWLTIDAQQRQLEMSAVHMCIEPGLNRFIGSTDNVFRCALNPDVIDRTRPLTVKIDSQVVPIDMARTGSQLWLEMQQGRWRQVPAPSPAAKGAHRYGTFKEVFRNRMIFVYGTHGSREENRWAFDKARYDAEKFWYQGNAFIDVIEDEEFDASKDVDRNVVLYGNSETNSAWAPLLASAPVQVTGKRVTVGNRTLTGRNLGCICIRPRPGSSTASVGAVSGTGIEGMRTSNRFPYMSPGIGLPDCTVFDSSVLTRGDDGILLTGFFGLDWSVERGEFVESVHGPKDPSGNR